MQIIVQLVEDHSGPDAHGPGLAIEFGDLTVITGEVDDQPVADGSTGQAGPRPTRDEVQPVIGGRSDHLGYLLGRSRKGNAFRHDLIDRRIGRVKLSG